MSQEQIKWASEHDWFVSATHSSVLVQDVSVDNTGLVHSSLVTFIDYQQLREWAGY